MNAPAAVVALWTKEGGTLEGDRYGGTWWKDGRRKVVRTFTVEIGSGGSTVMVEPELRKGLTRRVFRRMLDGSLEWAAYDDWRTHNERARFFGFASRDLPSSMTS